MEVKDQNKGAQRPSPVTFRVTQEQKLALKNSAGRIPVGEYIRFKLFEIPDPPQKRQRRVSPDQEILQEILQELANAKLANNLNQIARACNQGTLPVTEETEAAMQQAYQDIHDMREHLVKALGLRPKPPGDGT